MENKSSSFVGRLIELTASGATSWFGLLTTYFLAVAGTVLAYKKLQEALPANTPPVLVGGLAGLPLLLVLLFHALPTLLDQRRRKRLGEITGDLKPGYFRLAPREAGDEFARADNKHEEILRWLREPQTPVLYLTGQSGSGKSSLLDAWVAPRLDAKVIKLRGYQDPAQALEEELSTGRPLELRALLERACRQLKGRRLVVIFDQFEEFVILHADEQRARFERLLGSLTAEPIAGLTMLLVLRSDYIGLVEDLALPKLLQDRNWKEIPPFTEAAASAFLRGSGLTFNEDLLRDVLREAAQIEQAKGLIRPVTVNVCGLVLGRFASGLPRGFRPGGIIRGFLREAVEAPEIREVAPKIVPHLITGNLTKRPRTVTELARDGCVEEAAVRGCLRTLGKQDRGIVRPLDAEQTTWEIAHDFLVPLLDSIFARWSVSVWRRVRPWAPALAVATLIITAIGLQPRPEDAYRRLVDLRWVITSTPDGMELRHVSNPPFSESARYMELLKVPIRLSFLRPGQCKGIEALRGVTNLNGVMIEEYLSEKEKPIFDLALLSELTNLRTLGINFVRPTNLAALSKLTRLHGFSMADSPTPVDLAAFRELRSLFWLRLKGTDVSDLRPLTALKTLGILSISCTHVSDFTPLRELPRLQMVEFYNLSDSVALTNWPLFGELQARGVDLEFRDRWPRRYYGPTWPFVR